MESLSGSEVMEKVKDGQVEKLAILLDHMFHSVFSPGKCNHNRS